MPSLPYAKIRPPRIERVPGERLGIRIDVLAPVGIASS
jgi:hypothetical protein